MQNKLANAIKVAGGIWKFKYNSTESLQKVTIDPDKLYPDVNKNNNTWHAE